MGAKLDKALAIGLLGLIVLSALLYGAIEPWTTFAVEIVIALFLVLWAGQVAVTGRLELFVPATTYPMLAFLLFGALQSFAWVDAAGNRRVLSTDPEATQLVVLMLFLFIVAFLLFANFLVTPERIKPLVTFLIIFGALVAVFGLVQHFTWNGKHYWVHEKFIKGFGPFHIRNHFAGYVEMLASFPVAILLLRERKTEKRLLYGFATMVMGVAIVISLSRGGMLSLFSSLSLVTLISLIIRTNERADERSESRRRAAHQPAPSQMNLLARVGAGAIVIIAIAAGIFWLGADAVIDRVTGDTEKAQQMSVSERLNDARGPVWQEGLRVFKGNLLTGIGLGAYLTVSPTYSNFDSALLVDAETHNDYLQVLTDTGLVGGVLMLWFLTLLARDVQRGLQNPNPRLAALALGCGGGLSAMLIHSFFDFNLQIPSNALLFLLLTALAARLGQPVTVVESKRPALAHQPRESRRLDQLASPHPVRNEHPAANQDPVVIKM